MTLSDKLHSDALNFTSGPEPLNKEEQSGINETRAELALLKLAYEKLLADHKKTRDELTLHFEEKEKRNNELTFSLRELNFQNREKEKRTVELSIAYAELAFQNQEKEKKAEELLTANGELAKQISEKEELAAELSRTNFKLASQVKEKESRETELVQANNDLETSKEAFRQLSGELELKVLARTSQLELINKELEAFSYSVSHDLRAPIRAVSGISKILIEDFAEKLGEEGLMYLNLIISDSKRMGQLIDDLLAFSRLGRKQVTVSEINMTNLVETIKDELLHDDKSNLPTAFTISEMPNAYGDSSLIRQVWINLISNAIKYSKNKPTRAIEIGSSEHEHEIVYFIKDNGAGFDMQYYDKLFGVFQRLHSHEEFDGTGIGLAIVQKIVNRHSGKVWGESILNEGSCFYFTLPKNNKNHEL